MNKMTANTSHIV